MAKTQATQEFEQWAIQNFDDPLKWESVFTERELMEIRHCQHYARLEGHGTDGHNRMMVIAKMAFLLNVLEQRYSDPTLRT